ncbi:hypothetical protein ABKZ05_003940 [Vibrio navarrensis]
MWKYVYKYIFRGVEGGKGNIGSVGVSCSRTLDILVSGTEVKLTYPAEHTDIKILKS